VLEYCRYIIFEKFDTVEINRPEKFGGSLTFSTYRDLEKSFAKRELHPMDLKDSVAGYINQLVGPVREHFESKPDARQLLEQVRGFKVTR
jgi:tyrosyl-tRNA synthetase